MGRKGTDCCCRSDGLGTIEWTWGYSIDGNDGFVFAYCECYSLLYRFSLMRLKIKNNLLIVKVGFFDSSAIFALPMLLLPLINESHSQYIYVYAVLAAFYIVLYVKDTMNPAVYLDNKIIGFRNTVQSSYLNGFVKHEGMETRVTNIQLKNISNVEFNYPKILIFQYGEQYKITLKLSEKDFFKIVDEIAKKLDGIDVPYQISEKGLKKNYE